MLAVRPSEASTGSEGNNGGRQSGSIFSVEHRTPGSRRGGPVNLVASHLVGPAWSSMSANQQISGTNDDESWAAQRFSKYSAPYFRWACRMDPHFFHTCPIVRVKQVISHLHRMWGYTFSFHVDGRLERLSMRWMDPLLPEAKDPGSHWWTLAREGAFLVVWSSNSRIQAAKRMNQDQRSILLSSLLSHW